MLPLKILSKNNLNTKIKLVSITASRCCSNSSEGKKKPTIPVNLLQEEGYITAHLQTENGTVYEKKPFKITLDKDRLYNWCLCGKSHTQPFCDGTHKSIYLKIKQKPIKFKVAESGDYWLCNCKQTKHRPFCDGTHKNPEIQAGYSRM